MTGKTRTFRLLSMMIMLSAFLPIVFNNLPPVIRSHHIWTILWTITLIAIMPSIFREKILQLILLNALVILCIANDLVWVNVPEDAKKMIYYEFYEISIALSIIMYYRQSRDYYGLAQLVKATIICIAVTSIMSIFVSFINPMFARDIVGVEATTESQMEEVLSFKKFGGGGYGFYGALVCIFPVLIYFYKNENDSIYSRRTILALIALFFICLIRVQIFGNVLIAVIIIFFGFAGNRNLKKSFFIMALITGFLFLLPVTFYIDLLDNLKTFFDPDSHIRFKLDDMAVFLRNGAEIGVDTEAGIRAERFPLLWESFLSEPFTGGKYYNHHLHWMNKLATFGLVGIFPYALLFLSFFRSSMRFYPAAFKLYFLLAIFSILFLGTIKALFGRELWYAYFVIVPGIYYLRLLKKQPVYKVKRESSSYK